MANLITGAAGSAHITPLLDSTWHRGVVGHDNCILPVYNKMAPTVQSNQEVRIGSGVCMLEGRFIEIDLSTYDPVTIPNGSQGYNRIDYICGRITQNGNGTQSFEWRVVSGESTTGDAEPPEDYCDEELNPIQVGSLDAGNATVEYPFFQITLEGINITEAAIVADVMIDDCSMTEAEYDELAALLGISS